MNKEELLANLDLIEEQARLTIDEFPRELRKERQRTILRLVSQLRSAADLSGGSLPADPEATVKLIVS